jgi:hypothetical protein
MDAYDWVTAKLCLFQKEEIAAIKRVMTAKENLAKARADLAAAQETLIGVRGAITEFTWQMKYLKEHGRLP